MKKKELFLITIGDRKIRIKFNLKEFSEHQKSKEEFLIDKAIQKIFGPNCFWLKDSNTLYKGRVFKIFNSQSLKFEKPIYTNIAHTMNISIKKIEKEQKRDFPSYGR